LKTKNEIQNKDAKILKEIKDIKWEIKDTKKKKGCSGIYNYLYQPFKEHSWVP